MNAYQITIIAIAILVGFAVFIWVTRVIPFLDGLVSLKDERIRADFALYKKTFTPEQWSKLAKTLLNEVRQLKYLTVLCGFDAKNRVVMTEDLVRKEVALITEGELQRALLVAQWELVSAAKSGIFDADLYSGMSYEYFERLEKAYRKLGDAKVRLAKIVPEEGGADRDRFKKSFLELARDRHMN